MPYPFYSNNNFIYPVVCEYPVAGALVSALLLIVLIIILSSIGGEKK